MSNMTSHAWRGALIILVALTALGTVGCRRRGLQSGLAARYQRNLVRLAARDTGCAAHQLQPMQIGSQPDVFAVTGCTFPVEYWLQCRRRGRCRWTRVPTLNEQAAAPLQCQPQMIQQQFTQAPNMRIAAGCGRQATFAMACNSSACGWAMASPAQAPTAMATATATVPIPPGGPDTVPPPPATDSSGGNAVAMQLQAQREAILSCLDSPNITLNIRWTADGVIQVQLPPELAGSAAEGCVQAALSTLRITASQPGQLMVPVQ